MAFHANRIFNNDTGFIHELRQSIQDKLEEYILEERENGNDPITTRETVNNRLLDFALYLKHSVQCDE